jgi:hypothetical protein
MTPSGVAFLNLLATTIAIQVPRPRPRPRPSGSNVVSPFRTRLMR